MLSAPQSSPTAGVFVPAALIYSPQLPPAAVHTWMQLRGLAGSSRQTQPYTIPELCKLTSKRQTALYSHLALLKSSGVLRYRSAGKGTIILIFDDFEDVDAPTAASPAFIPPPAGDPVYIDDDTHAAPPPEDDFDQTPSVGTAARPDVARDSFRPSASPPTSIPDELNSTVRENSVRNFDIPEFRNSVITEFRKNEISPSLNPPNKLIKIQEEEGGEGKIRNSGKPESRKTRRGKSEPPSDDPVEIFHALTGRRPNQAQRHELYYRVTDADLWRQSVAHWLMHGWNPTNVLGQLDFYCNGGPPTCRACAPRGSSAGGAGPAAQSDPFDELIAEYNQRPKRGRAR